MKKIQLISCTLALCALTACSNTWEGMKTDTRHPDDKSPPSTVSHTWRGMKSDWQDNRSWAKGEPSQLEESFGKAPRGYAAAKSGETYSDGSGRVFKPSRANMVDEDTLPVTVVSDRGSQDVDAKEWGDLGDVTAMDSFDAGLIEPAKKKLIAPINYKDLSVYPVIDDEEENAMAADQGLEAFNRLANNISNFEQVTMARGPMLGQIYFAYGSDRIGKFDRQNIASIAKKDKKTGEGFTVIGHASKRVDGVTDPIRRKEINFEMAQKRAIAVTEVLHRSGVKPGMVMAISRGDEEPNPDAVGKMQEPADRRAEIYRGSAH